MKISRQALASKAFDYSADSQGSFLSSYFDTAKRTTAAHQFLSPP